MVRFLGDMLRHWREQQPNDPDGRSLALRGGGLCSDRSAVMNGPNINHAPLYPDPESARLPPYVPLTEAWAMGSRAFRRGVVFGALVAAAVCIAVMG